MKPQVLLNYFIKPSLDYLSESCRGINGLNSKQMMLAICGQESHCGQYFKQLDNGSAQGPWQVEKLSYNDLRDNFIQYREGLDNILAKMFTPLMQEPLIQSPMYNCAIARLCLYRYDDPMPALNDKSGMWEFYKKRYNSYLGAATEDEWNRNWEKYVAVIDEFNG